MKIKESTGNQEKDYPNQPVYRGGGILNRSSNFELFRIILMLLIIGHHYVVNSGLIDLYDFKNITGNMIFLQIFGMWGKTVINCFSLLTGYHMVKSNITIKKFLKIYLEIKFYTILIYLIFFVTGYEVFSIKGLLKAVLSVAYSAGTGYTGTYMMCFLFIPLLNRLIKNINKRLYQWILGLLFFYFTFLSTFLLHDTFNYLGWMMTMYLLGGYISLYPCKFFDSLKSAVIGLMLSIVLAIASILTVDFIGVRIGFSNYYHMVTDSHKFLALASSVFAFLLFKNLKINISRCINRIAASTFGVLLIHANSDTMRRFLWCDMFKNQIFYESGFLPLHAIGVIVIVYVVCLIIDQLRIKCIENPLFAKLRRSECLAGLEEKLSRIV